MVKTRCPSCGKSTTLDRADAGLPVVCLACGGRFTAPLLPGADAPPGAVGAGDAAPSRAAHVGRTFWVAAVLGTLAAAAALLLVVRGRPDPIDRATALALASQAQAHAAEGRLADAHRKYHELETIVGGGTVRDGEVRRVVDQAKADQQRVYALLLDEIGRQRQAPAAAAASQPALAAAAVTTRPGIAQAATAPSAESRVNDVAAGPSAAPAEVGAAEAGQAGTSVAATPSAVASATAPATATAAAPTTASVTPPTATSAPTTRPAVATGPHVRPPIRPMPETPDGVTDEQIGQAIQNGVNHLLSRFNADSHTLEGADTSGADGGGTNALAVYALMQCGQAIGDERLNVRGRQMDAMIEAMKESRLRRGHAQTYATGIRATALSLFNRPQDRAVLKLDVAALVQSSSLGSYTYAIDTERPRSRGTRRHWDNSNSQYGLLGVWAGAEAGAEVPSAYWMSVETHWVESQLSDGQWSYASEPRGKISMTAAGIASLFVTHDWLDAPKFAKVVGREPFSPALQRGLNWFEEGDNAITIDTSYWGYTLYGIERVGLASGLKFFGRHDWYRRLAADVIARQGGDGSWGDTVDTSFALLFLARGRHPVLMNKVRFGGFWANRPRDVANLARFASRALERELNWQVVPLRSENEWTDWLDSPILYLASHKEPTLVEQDHENLRQFVAAGGLLFTHADGDSEPFNKWADGLAATLFSKYEMKDLPPDHPVYNLVFKIDDDQRPRLRGVSNGSRLLMVHSPADVARSWQLRDTTQRKGLFHLGVNMFLYAAGKRDLRNRLDSTFVSDPGAPQNGSVSVARLEYPGNWDPEPAAWPRFSRWFQRRTGTGLNVARAALAALKPGQAPLAHLTGTTRHDFSGQDVAAVKAYVEAGGVLLVDQCGGTGSFDQGVLDTLLSKAFPGAALEPLDPAGHPMFRAGGPTSGMDDLTKARLRPFSVQGRGNEATPVSGFAAGAGHVVFLPIDVTSGLLGSRTWGIAGLHPDYAPAFVKNLVLWTLDGQAGE